MVLRKNTSVCVCEGGGDTYFLSTTVLKAYIRHCQWKFHATERLKKKSNNKNDLKSGEIWSL